jgi:hypothetical protein
MLYGSETWTIAKAEQEIIEAFEMWCYRRILKISWMDMVTNEEVLERMAEKRTLWNVVKKRRNEWIGHVIRHGGLLRLTIEGCVEGKNCRGRSQMEYLQQIMKDQRCKSYEETKRKASNSQQGRVENCYKPISGLNTKKEEGQIIYLPTLLYSVADWPGGLGGNIPLGRSKL